MYGCHRIRWQCTPLGIYAHWLIVRFVACDNGMCKRLVDWNLLLKWCRLVKHLRLWCIWNHTSNARTATLSWISNLRTSRVSNRTLHFRNTTHSTLRILTTDHRRLLFTPNEHSLTFRIRLRTDLYIYLLNTHRNTDLALLLSQYTSLVKQFKKYFFKELREYTVPDDKTRRNDLQPPHRVSTHAHCTSSPAHYPHPFWVLASAEAWALS